MSSGVRCRIFSTGRPKIGLADGKFRWACARAEASFQPEAPKTASRMENSSGHALAPKRFFNRKAEKWPRGWNFFFSALAGTGGCYVGAPPRPRCTSQQGGQYIFSPFMYSAFGVMPQIFGSAMTASSVKSASNTTKSASFPASSVPAFFSSWSA